MTLIKRKSLIVALISSLVISLVLVLTLIGYLIYIELQDEEIRRSYNLLLQKTNAKFYSKHVEVTRLGATIAASGALKGRPIVEGVLKNKGYRPITDLLLKVKFLDKDDAVIYEVTLHPQEPSLGAASLTKVAIPYIYNPHKVILKPDESLPFKRVLTNCPKGIFDALDKAAGIKKASGRWSGRLVVEFLSIEF